MASEEEDKIAPRSRWRTAQRAGIATLGLAVVLGGAWFYRLPLGEALIRLSLGAKGAQTDFRLETLDFSGANARAVRIGDPKAPDFWADRARIDLDWSRGLPRIGGIALSQGGLRAAVDEHGVSLGALAKLGPGKIATSSPQLPDWAIRISDFRLLGATPIGLIDAPLTASGHLQTDFKAHADTALADLSGPQGGAKGFRAQFDASTIKGQLNLVLDAQAAALTWRQGNAPPTELSHALVSAQAVLPVDLSSATAGASISATRAKLGASADIGALNASARMRTGAFKPGFLLGDFTGDYVIETGPSALSGVSLSSAAIKGPLSGDTKTAPLIGIESALAKTADSSLALGRTSVAYKLGAQGSLALKGPALFSGPLAGLTFTAARAPLDVAITWGDGFRVAPAACITVQSKSIAAPGMSFPGAQAVICPDESGAFVRGDKQGKLAGGFVIDKIDWRGRMDGRDPAPAHLTVAQVEGRVGGDAKAMSLDVTLATPDFAAEYSPVRSLRARAQSVTARVLTGNGWGLTGMITGLDAQDTSLPLHVTDFTSPWSGGARRDGQAVFRFENGHGRLFDPAKTPLYHPLLAQNVAGVIEDGGVKAQGALTLEEKPTAKLGAFTVNHDFASGMGEARVTARDVTFRAALQPYDVSEFARGAVDNVRGPVDVDMHFAWTPDRATSDGRVEIKDIDLASSSLGPIEGLSGTIVFNDLATLSTPPGQKLSVRSINPGIAVANGSLSIQLQPDQHVVIESATWPFAEGVLAVEPTTIQLNADETRLSLTLTDVDVAALTDALNFKGLTATGHVQGRFPLIFTKTKGRLENGRLEAAPGGGTIAYQSDVKAGGAGGIAFDALRSFHYDSLTLDLNGDLDGELVTAINFTGVNKEPIDPAKTIVPLKVAGIPFKFNVTVRAPFMAMANNAAGFADPRRYLRGADAQADVEAATTGTPADPAPAPDAPK